MHVFRNTAGVWNLTNDYYRPTDQREVMTIIDPLTVVNSTSCYSVDSCSFIETPGVFEISKDPAIFFEHESHESYETRRSPTDQREVMTTERKHRRCLEISRMTAEQRILSLIVIR